MLGASGEHAVFVDWFHSHPTISITFGAATIAIGGWIATLGWEGRSAHAARRTMLEILYAEVQVNEALLGHSVFTEERPEKLIVVRVIPSFHDSALRAAISSGAFSHQKDQELLDGIVALENSIIYFRQFTEVYHGLLLKASNFPSQEAREKELRKLWLGLREAASLAQIRANIQSLKILLESIEPMIEARPSWLVPEEESIPQATSQ